MKISKFLINTRGCINSNNICFLICLILAMFGYTHSPFYKLNTLDTQESKEMYNMFLKVVKHIKNDLHPNITIIRNFLPLNMQN